MKKLLSIMALLLPLLTLSFAPAFASTGNTQVPGGIAPNTFTPVSASTGGGWNYFTIGNTTNAQPPLPGVSWVLQTFQVYIGLEANTPELISIKVTDVWIAGDSFDLWSVNSATAPTAGTLIGTTPAVPSSGDQIGNNPEAAFLNSSYSHGIFTMMINTSGYYNFTIRVVNFPAGYVDSEGYMEFLLTPASVGGYVLPSNDASILISVLLPFAFLGALGLAVAYRKKLGF